MSAWDDLDKVGGPEWDVLTSCRFTVKVEGASSAEHARAVAAHALRAAILGSEIGAAIDGELEIGAVAGRNVEFDVNDLSDDLGGDF